MIVDACDEFSGSSGDDHFIIEVGSECSVLLVGGSGADLYTVNPSPATTITVADFDIETDKIDLRPFQTIKNMKQLNITAGSVRVNLPHRQTIVLPHYHPSDVRANNFIFANGNETNGLTIGLAMILFVIVMAVGTLCVGNHIAKNIDWDDFIPEGWGKSAEKTSPKCDYPENVPRRRDVESGYSSIVPIPTRPLPKNAGNVQNSRVSVLAPIAEKTSEVTGYYDISSDESSDDDIASSSENIDFSDSPSEESSEESLLSSILTSEQSEPLSSSIDSSDSLSDSHLMDISDSSTDDDI